jgi:hypothetical protein
MAEMGKGPSGLKGPLREVKPIEAVVERWNAVVDGLMSVKENWGKMQEMLQGIPRSELMMAPMEVQKAVARFRKAKFEVMLERFVAHYRAFGGLEAMRVKKGGEK